MLTENIYADIINFVVRNTEGWSSWFKAPVLKTDERESVPWVRIPLPPPFFYRHIETMPWRNTQVAKEAPLLRV
jgi:hypothetical protein